MRLPPMRLPRAAALAVAVLVPLPAVPEAEARQERPRASAVQRGHASYYAPKFNGRRMANGKRFDPRSQSAAHRSLPFGTRVRVTHLGSGRSEVVTIEDRGPFVRGRIIDLSPRTAERLGMRGQGVAMVELRPLAEE